LCKVYVARADIHDKMNEADVVVLFELFKSSSVSEVLNAMQVNPKWRRLLTKDAFWKRFIFSKELRDRLYSVWDGLEAMGTEVLYDFPYGETFMDDLTVFMVNIVKEYKRPRLQGPKRVKSYFTLFMFLWTALGHVFLDMENNAIELFRPLSIFATPFPAQIKYLLDTTNMTFEEAAMDVINRMEPSYFFGRDLELPYIHLEVDSNNTLTVVRHVGSVPQMGFVMTESTHSWLRGSNERYGIFGPNGVVMSSEKWPTSSRLLIRQIPSDVGYILLDIEHGLGRGVSMPASAPPFFYILITSDGNRFRNVTLAYRYTESDGSIMYGSTKNTEILSFVQKREDQQFMLRDQCVGCGIETDLIDANTDLSFCGKECQKEWYKKI